jgi:hypothetical protein
MDKDRQRLARAGLLVVLALALAACAGSQRRHEHGPAGEGMSHEQMMKRPMAHAHFQPATGQGAAGRVMFHELDGPKLYLHAKLSGLPPGGTVTLSLRDGDCGAASAAHAGHAGHGGAPSSPAPALPGLVADAQGAIDAKRVLDGAGLAGATGRALWLGGPDGRALACALVAAGHHGRH